MNVSNIYEMLNTNYNNLNFIIDINNIIKCGFSNTLIASNVYNSAEIYKHTLDNINNELTININNALTDLTLSSNIFNQCCNLNRIKGLATTSLLDVVTSNKILSYDIYYCNDKISSNILYNYSQNIGNLNNPIMPDLNLMVLIDKTNIITNKLKTSVNNNLSIYLDKSTSNQSRATFIDNTISSLNNDYNEDLNYYRNIDELNNGTALITTYLSNEIITFENFKNNIINLFSEYIIDDSFKDEYDNNIMMVDFCIKLLRELKADTEDLYDNITVLPASILLELSMDITNKYINFINNSYNFANSTSKVIESINNNIDIYILSSLSILPLLNTMIEYANIHLYEAWDVISRKIVLFASLSYSLNVMASSSVSLTNNTTNDEGKNTDVLIIGNNIKLYPNKSLIIGYENDYTRWLELINDTMKKSVVYFFNSEYNSCISSFNSRAQKFKSSLTSSTSLKTSASIDLNLVDTSIKNYEESMFDGVSFKLSHIYHRDNINSANATSNNTIFEINRKQNPLNPYFSIYSIYDKNENIFNIGKGIFYDDNNKCINDDMVLHINEGTSKHLLKLSNPSTNPLTLSFNHNNNNNWIFSFTNKFNLNYNSNNIITITSNGLNINDINNTNEGSLYINSFNNLAALTLKNNYELSIQIRDVILKDKINVAYTNDGIVYTKKADGDTYDFSKVIFDVNNKILINNISYVLSNVIVSFNNIDDTNPFNVNIIDGINNIYLLPDIRFNDTNVSYTNNYIKNQTINYQIPIGNTLFTNKYIMPLNVTSFESQITGIGDATTAYDYLITTNMIQGTIPNDKYTTIILKYEINGKKIHDVVKYYKFGTFINETLTIIISEYNYNLIRNNNVVPKSLYKNPHTNTITKSIVGNKITINNNLDYLKVFENTIKYSKTFTQNIIKIYEITIFDIALNIPIEFTIRDNYQVYFIDDEANLTSLPIEYINSDINLKLPLIKQKNIYGNYHSIYSYTDDYEIYFNANKLLNIDDKGTLTTTGNIYTNNIYLKGDIYNSDGASLYDNILSLITNISSTTNFELNSKNIVLNPIIRPENNFRGGILINGNNINEINNNLFQINNNIDNDNFITLNSCTRNSYIHFNNKIGDYINQNYINSIYRLGTSNNSFGIWKYNNFNTYTENYYIDTSTTNNYIKSFDVSPISDTNTFDFNINGILTQIADSRLNTDMIKIDNALEKIMTLEGITYKYTSGNIGQKRQTGLIGQQVKEILPEAVTENADGFYNIAYGNLTGLIIEAIKDLKNEINDLKSRII